MTDYRVLGTDSSVWRPIFVWDSFADDDTLVRFFCKLSETNHVGSTSDKVRWKLNSKGCYIVKSFYLKLLNLNYLKREIMGVTGFPCQIIWRSLAPVKVSLFVWEASHGKILTIDNLQRRGFTIFKGEGSPWLIDATRVKENSNQWIICCFIARLQGLFGTQPLIVWGFAGLHPIPLRTIF